MTAGTGAGGPPRSGGDGGGDGGGGRGTRRAVGAVVVRPRLWATALRQAGRMAAPGWWRRPPFLPRPDRRYLAFRFETHAGAADRPLAPHELVAYLEWCRTEDRRVRGTRRRRR
jgi:hypothetical protein